MARSGFYAWRQRQQNPGPRAQENAVITAQLQAVYERHRGFYGAPRVHQELRAAGLKVGRHRVARLMRCSALKAKTRRGFRPCRNPGNRASGVAENLLQQEFSPAAPNRCWAGDIARRDRPPGHSGNRRPGWRAGPARHGLVQRQRCSGRCHPRLDPR
ncbi:IS3 family transposase [Cyanobium sp. Aljojuca 7D2]|nr:IS3 family transposase [Cyanobium sp. Aljojuca 7D2]